MEISRILEKASREHASSVFLGSYSAVRVGMLMIWIQWPADRSVVTTPETRGCDGHSSIITNYVPTNSSQAPSISSLPLLYFITAQSNARPCAVSEAVCAHRARH